MAENVGTIWYVVEARTQKILDSIKPVDQSLDGLGRTFDKTDGSAKKAEFQMKKTSAEIKSIGNHGDVAARQVSSLIKALGGAIAIGGAGGLIQMAESYGEMAERIKDATDSAAEYEMVQKRIAETAKGTYRPLAEAQEVFIQSSRGLRDMRYSTEEALDIVDSLSYSFVRNATSADKAGSALNALTRAVNRGTVLTDHWASLLIATPTLLDDIARATGKTSKEISALGYAGKLSAEALTEGLRLSLEENKKAADDMATTVADAFVSLRNSLATYIGEANMATGSTQLISGAISALGENIDTVVKVLTVAGAVALAKYISGVGIAAKNSMMAGLEAHKKAAATLRAAQADEAAAAAALRSAQAAAQLGGSHEAAAKAMFTHEAATKRLTAAQAAFTSVGSRAMALLGGPAGIIAMTASAAASMLLFSSNAKAAESALVDLAIPLEEAIDKFKRLSQAQREGELINAVKAQADAAKAAAGEFDRLAGAVYSSISTLDGMTDAKARALVEALQSAADAGDDLTPILKSIAQSAELPQRVVDLWLSQNSEFDKAREKSNDLSSRLSALSNENDRLANASRNAAAGVRELSNAFDVKAASEYLEAMVKRRHAIEDGNNELKKAQRFIGQNSDMPEGIKDLILSEAEAMERLKKSLERSTAATKTHSKAQAEAVNAAKQNAKAIADLEQQLRFAALSGEALAVAKAEASLNEFATPTEIERVRELSAELFAMEQTARRISEMGADPSQWILGDRSPLSGGLFDDQFARYDAEAQQEDERYWAQLDRLNEALQLERVSYEEHYRLIEQMTAEHNSRLDQIDQARTSLMLSTASSAFDSLAGVMRSAAGEQSGIYKAMFAASKAFAIAESIIKIQQGIANAAALPFPSNIPAMAQVASATAGIVSTIASTSYGGGRQYGGPVSAGKGYRINENGKPEIFNAANGQQYLLPNTRGQVVSNKNAGGGGSVVNVSVTINSDGSSNVSTDPAAWSQQGREMGEAVRSIVRREIDMAMQPGGKIRSSMYG